MTAIGNASLHWLHVGLTGSNAGLDILKLENIESKDVIFSKHDEQNEAAGRQGGVESYRGGWRDDQVRILNADVLLTALQAAHFPQLTALPLTVDTCKNIKISISK